MNQGISWHDAVFDFYEKPIYWSTLDSFCKDINIELVENSIRNEYVDAQNIARVSKSPVKYGLSLEYREPGKASGEITNGFISLDANSRVSCKNIEWKSGVKSGHYSEYKNALAGPPGIWPCMVKKTDREIFASDLCCKKFAKSWEFDIHYETHADKKFVKKSTENVDFDNNCRMRTGEKSLVCGVCQKEFAYKSYLVRHYRTHTGEKPFMCKVCQKEFTYKSHLVTHYRIHTGDKPYMCNICQRKFNEKGNLNKHYKTHTVDIPFVCDMYQIYSKDKSVQTLQNTY